MSCEESAWLSGQDLDAEVPGSNPQLGPMNEFVLGDPRGKFTTLLNILTGLPPISWDS